MTTVETNRLRVQKVALAGLLGLIVIDPSAGLFGPLPHYAALGVLTYAATISGLMSRFKRLTAAFHVRPLLFYVLIFSAVLPLYGLTIHALRAPVISGNAAIFNGAFIHLAVLALCVASGVGLQTMHRTLVLILTGLAGVIWLLLFASHFVPYLTLYAFGSGHHIYAFQYREYLRITVPYIYYFTSPLLVVAATYWMNRIAPNGRWSNRRFALFAFIISAMILSGTRMNILLALVLVTILVWRRWPAAGWLLSFAAVIWLARNFDQLATLFHADGAEGVGYSNQVKVGLLDQYMRAWSDKSGLLFGFGLGSCIESMARGECMSTTELTYLDTIRIFGVLGGLAYFALLAAPVFRIRRHFPDIWLAYLLYLVSALFNPYVFSSLGATVIALAVLAMCSETDEGTPDEHAQAVGANELSGTVTAGVERRPIGGAVGTSTG